MKFLCYSVMLPLNTTLMFSSNLLNIFPLAYYYEIYLLPIFVVLLSCNSLMLSKLKFEAKSQVASLILMRLALQTWKMNKNNTEYSDTSSSY